VDLNGIIYLDIIRAEFTENYSRFKEFEYSINSGAWFTVSSPDTTLMFGSFKEENNKYFLDSAWTEEEMEE
jgi:hypothetical protein